MPVRPKAKLSSFKKNGFLTKALLTQGNFKLNFSLIFGFWTQAHFDVGQWLEFAANLFLSNQSENPVQVKQHPVSLLDGDCDLVPVMVAAGVPAKMVFPLHCHTLSLQNVHCLSLCGVIFSVTVLQGVSLPAGPGALGLQLPCSRPSPSSLGRIQLLEPKPRSLSLHLILMVQLSGSLILQLLLQDPFASELSSPSCT